MIERLRANPFPVLWTGLAALVMPFLLMGRQVLAEKRSSSLPPKLEGLEDLVEPSLPEKELVARARDHLRKLGLEANGYFHGLRLDFDQEAFGFLKKRHAAEEIGRAHV